MAGMTSLFSSIGSSISGMGASDWLGLAGSAASLFGNVSGDKANEKEADVIRANADLVQESAEVSEHNAIISRAAADREAEQIRKESRRYQGAIRAGIGKAGVTSEGTPIMVMAESAMNAELDALNIAFRGAQQAQAHLTQAKQIRRKADIMRMQADSLRKGSNLSSAAGLLQTGATIASVFLKK